MKLTDQIKKIDLVQRGKAMYDLSRKLFPICRSITGNGVRESLKILQKIIPIQQVEVPTGTRVLDWEVPEEWNIRDAYIKDPKGKKIIDFKKLNLHVLNYSVPIDQNIELKALKEHIFTLPDSPDWVPYRTSYHNRQWGFCMAHNQLENLAEGTYEVKIDSDIGDGALTYGEYYVRGKSDKEVLISCHICHPSLCNDNLSGNVLAAFLARELSSLDLQYSYRFLFIPGTIGSITWLSRNENSLDRIKYGLVLTLLGDSSPFHYKRSRKGNAEIDRIVEYALKNETKGEVLDFSPYGYDERQFCSPGFNLPVGRLSRKPHGEFPEYHTSADNLDFISKENLADSMAFLLKVVTIIEENHTWINLNPKGEPQLGRRGLYKQVGGQSQQKDYQMAILWVLNLSDGDHTLLDIAIRSGIEFGILSRAASDLEKVNLLRKVN